MTKRSFFIVFALLAYTLWNVSGCKQTADLARLPAIDPPMPQYEPKVQTFKLDAALGDSIRIASGTKIVVPPNAFVDTAGVPITGEIELTYRELHNALDVFLAGAPMNYDSLDGKGYMQTAGMFEVRAYANKAELNLAKEKVLSVRMASFEGGNDYNFYNLNEDSIQWEYQGTNVAEVNTELKEIREKIKKLQPEHPFPLTKDYFVFQLGTALDIFFRNNWNRIQKSSTKFMAKKLEEYGMDYIDIQAHSSIKIWGRYHYASEILWKKKGGVKVPSWATIKGAHISEIKRVRGSTYKITIQENGWKKKNPKKFRLTAVAYLPLAKVLRRKPDQWKEQYASIMKEIEIEQKRLRTEAQVFRSYDVTKTGWCNWDRIKQRFNTVPIVAKFVWPGSDKESDEEKAVYYFIDNQTSYVRIYERDWGKVELSEDKTAFFISVIGSDSIAVFDTQLHSAIDFEGLKQKEIPELEIPMKLYVTESKGGLEKLLASFKREKKAAR